jgi:acyl-CoA dehydrogenase
MSAQVSSADSLVADAANRLFAAHAPASAGVDSGPLPRAFWKEFVESGLGEVLAQAGDSRFHDAAAVARACGYHAVAAPVAEAMLAQWLAARAGWPAETGVATVWLGPRASTAPAFERVPWGREADALYCIAEVTGQGRISRAQVAGARIGEGRNLAGEPRDAIAFPDGHEWKRAPDEADALEAYAVGALLRAAQMAGAMERALELSLEHANTRVQFGRAIGKFQAVQQMLALLASHAAAASAAVDLGSDGLASGDGLPEAAVAKARAGEAAGFAAEIAHQVIAAMGFTMEHPLHRFTRRLWSWRDECGNETFWNRRIGAEAIARGLWAQVADRPWLEVGDGP